MKRYIKSVIQPLSDLDFDAMYELAADKETPAEALQEIAKGAEATDTLDAIITNPNVTPEIIDYIVHKEGTSTDVDCSAAYSKKTSSATLDAIVDKLMHRHSWTPETVVVTLEAVAANPNVTQDTLQKLTTYNGYYSDDVLKSLAHSPKLSMELAQQLLDIEPSLSFELLQNPNIAPTLISYLYGIYDEDDSTFRIAITHSDYVTPEMLSQLANDPSYSVRSEVARNERTPIPALEMLCEAEEVNIRIQAERTLKWLKQKQRWSN